MNGEGVGSEREGKIISNFPTSTTFSYHQRLTINTHNKKKPIHALIKPITSNKYLDQPN